MGCGSSSAAPVAPKSTIPRPPPPKPKSGYVLGETADINEYYTIEEPLGQPGQFGRAHKCRCKFTREERAVKIINKKNFLDKYHFEEFKNEIDILQTLDHPNVIRGYDFFETDDELFLVLELCTGGELFDRIQEYREREQMYTEKEASSILRQLMEGLKYLHERKIAHCDLKPDNFMFKAKNENRPIKIIDFGMSKHCKHRKYFNQLAGTAYYIAPEVLEGEYRESCDMWSMGVVMFVMLYGFPPFNGEKSQNNDEEIFRAITRGFQPVTKPGFGAWFPQQFPRSDSAKDLMTKLLKSDPAERLTANEALRHPWLNGEAASEKAVLGGVVKSIHEFTSSCKLKKVILSSFASKITEEDAKVLQQAFREADEDKSGSLTLSEFKKAMVKCGFDAKMDVESLMKTMDADGDGTISYKELQMAAAQSRLLATEERLWREFRRLDINGDGKISAKEITQTLGVQGDQLLEMIKEVDKNSDGEIDYDEFLTMWISKEQAEKLKQSS